MNIIKTDRLILRTVLETDIDVLHDIIFSNPEVMSQAFSGNTLTTEETKQFVDANFDHNGNGRQLGVLALKSDNTVIGFSGLLACSALGQKDFEIGFVLGKEHWGKGYASEIGQAQIEYGLGSLGCQRLLALVAPKNKASSSVLNKIGMHLHSKREIKDRGTKDIYIIEANP
ncbi:GNAT family N-acetyltransferase [Cocleimonas sp. KMM 6892]|uniref:GNAT family N-acetyltransferase n=1 Tax=unclassified Cocleimonas TaxID=2639732 RepID=UPI002DBD73B0|nr:MULTISPECIES: GNAT family N-acetyltransferase [unclassified Cocleimonas]MEB8432801.1 GNAT family N-acetyltransferase [Cocleimonas sp. KMM 6892]MEC4715660.1 GNAT family N-acetyltransferase [Cocleimonas sp. KMM 6895]MEC4744722.1 GNAT family N-acetyltransferase [Cocleimonas sp. KMM 6896]